MFVVKRSGDRKLNLEVEDRDQIMVDPDREKKSDKAGLSMRGLYLYIRSRSRAWKTVMMAMMVAIVFLTTYGLILPAITVEKKIAQDMPGVHLASDSSHDEERRTSGDRDQDQDAGSQDAEQDVYSKEERNPEPENYPEEVNPEQEKNSDDGHTLSCQTPDGKVTLSYGKKALIPEETCLELTVIRKGSAEYRSYEKILKREHKTLSADLYYRIRLTRNNREIQPEKAVDIIFTRNNDDNHKKISKGVLFREENDRSRVRLIEPDQVKKDQEGDSESTIFKNIPLQKKKTIPVIGLISSGYDTAENTEVKESDENTEN